MQKAIAHILYGREKRITETETVRQSLPHQNFRFANPFIVLHHMGPENIVAGVEVEPRIHPHPHRGFAPVTFMLQGQGYHKDNAGHDMIVNAGDVQWMFAGKGILHSEGPTKQMLQDGGPYELLQLWVNVPKANKWGEPTYQYASKNQLPKIIQQEGVNLRLVSGHYDNATGPMETFSPIISFVGEIEKGKSISLKGKEGYWTLVYIAHGKVRINGSDAIEQHNLIVFEKDNEEIILQTEEDTQILFLSAEPIEEPVTAKDNFVMNTAEEIEQALTDAKNGAFGKLSY